MRTGTWNELKVDRIKDFGVYLTDGSEDVLLPRKQVPEGTKVGDTIKAFIYMDSSDRPIATLDTPLIELGRMAKLKCKAVSDFGAFMDWGLEKDIFLPFKQQTIKVVPGSRYLVRMYVDKSGRPCVSMKLYDFLDGCFGYEEGSTVTGTIYEIRKGFGAFVAIDDKYSGLIHQSEIFDKVFVGEEVSCRIVKIREDGKADLSMREAIPQQMNKDAEMVYDIIKSYDGVLPFTDKASAELIKTEFGISKNAFKRAVGRLLKEGKVKLTERSITLTERDN